MPLELAYAAVVKKLDIDTVILVDGGTDSIIKGDEPGIGTVVEDATSIVAVNELDIPRKLLACLDLVSTIFTEFPISPFWKTQPN